MLENNELTLQKIIDDDQIYGHVKNRELIKFFDKQQVKTLIDFITIMPQETDTNERKYKYPFRAMEILMRKIIFNI